MQTILGSGGAIGRELAKALTDFTKDIRLVSRKPVKVNPDDHLHPADLTDAAAVRRAVEGSEVVYVTVGFPYSKKVWKETWPPFIKSVIDACKAEGCKLVFFDNIYMYDPDHLDGMTEETQFATESRLRNETDPVEEIHFTPGTPFFLKGNISYYF
ncbi:MAG: NAD(P)H-binding protein [Bacteroidetes bacterium]|nr:NAD(P)H-binding protein [Bacteroidota bacterium]MDA0973202.1 NAD(P)H-binding protein [Bacteroidota bacterium]